MGPNVITSSLSTHPGSRGQCRPQAHHWLASFSDADGASPVAASGRRRLEPPIAFLRARQGRTRPCRVESRGGRRVEALLAHLEHEPPRLRHQPRSSGVRASDRSHQGRSGPSRRRCPARARRSSPLVDPGPNITALRAAALRRPPPWRRGSAAPRRAQPRRIGSSPPPPRRHVRRQVQWAE